MANVSSREARLTPSPARSTTCFDFDDRDEDHPRKLILDEKTGAVVFASGGDDDDQGHDHDHH
jgi:hypothetical protein